MEVTGTRWLVTLCLLAAAQCLPSRVHLKSETDSDDSRKVLGSSVVTSVSVIMDHGNGTKTYFTDGQSKHVHKPTDTVIGSPGNLLAPDRYEFYTFDETGDLVKRLMTLDEIHGLIAGTDPESVIGDTSPTYYHDALSTLSSEALMHLPASDLESLDAPAVHKVLESVQNVLKNEMAANSGKPGPVMPSASLQRPDSTSTWSALFPGLIETPDDVAHLSGYLIPSKTTEPTDKPLTKKPLTVTKVPLTSIQPPVTTVKLPPPTIKTQQLSTTTEKIRSTPKYTTDKPESTTKFTPTKSTTPKPITTKKPFRPAQSFDKQKPALQKPTLILNPTARPAAVADSLDINKEMSVSISDMLSQVTDSQLSNHRPLQTNALVEKDNTADYVPEESSPELSYYSPMAMAALSTADGLKPVTEALTSARRPPSTSAYKATTTEVPYSRKPASTITTTRFAPFKSSVTNKPQRPTTNGTAAAHTTKPSATYGKFNGTATTATTAASATRNNYQYPPSNMSTKYMQKITQTTQVYPNKSTDHPVKVVDRTVNNTTLRVKQPTDAPWNPADVENSTLAAKEPNKVFQTRVTSARPSGVNRTNVTLTNRVQELKTTGVPGFGGLGSSTSTVRSQTAEPDRFVSVKVEEWPTTSTQQHPAAVGTTAAVSTTPYATTDNSFSSGTGQQLLNAITDANAIRDLISSLMTKPTAATGVSTSAGTPTTSQTLTAAVSTTSPTPARTDVPAPVVSSTTESPSTTTTTTTASLTTAAGTTTSVAGTTTAAAGTTTTAAGTTTTTTTAAAGTTSTAAATETAKATVKAAEIVATTTSAATSTIASTTAADRSSTATSAATSTTTTTEAPRTTAATATTVAPTTLESETQYVPVTHFLPELQVKDKPETENNNSSPGVDSMLKDGISAVASMLQNTQKPAILSPEYHEIGQRPYEKVTTGAVKQSFAEQQAQKHATAKWDLDETTTASGTGATKGLFELITTTTTTTTTTANANATATATEAAVKIREPNDDAVAMESVTTGEVFGQSEHGPEMLTVFNVSSTGGPGQAAKLADFAADTQTFFDSTTTPYRNPVTTDPVTEIGTTVVPATNTPTTTTSEVQNASTPADLRSTAAGPENATAPTAAVPTTPSPAVKLPGPSPNAYRPLANGASPSTVELHPAPHESMGLEASVAFLGDDVRRFADLCNELSFKMWTAVTGKGQISSRSLVLSPFELTAMLAMVFLGARGSTSGQMNDVLRLDDMITFNPHQVLRNITHSIANVNNPGVATASFVREIYSNKGNGKILEFYKERVQQYYDGHVEEVDFNTIGDVLRRRTNLLVKRQTLGRVVEYLRGSGLSLTPPFAAFSANVFQTSCETASTDGRDGEMYFVVRPSTRQRRLVPVPAAVWRGGFLAGYEPGLDATAVCLNPESAVSTILVLPGQQGQVAPGDGLARLEQRLIETSYRRGGWSRILRSLLPRPGLELQVPRFSHRSVLNATAALQRMGLKDVFSDQRADLRGVNGLYDLYLSDMLQVNTFSTCGEDAIGARHHVETYPASPQRMGRAEPPAAARRRRRHAADDPALHSPYSHLPLSLRPRQARLPDAPRLRFDRPFLYVVRHNPTGMIVYLGRFNPRLLP